MAKLTADDILALAAEAQLMNPRIILRKLNSGRFALVLKHGPDTDRAEIVFDRSADPQSAAAVLANVQPV